MSDVAAREKRRLERLLGMGEGYVLDFSNRTFADLILDITGRDIYDAKYHFASGSKANRLRAFWDQEPNHVVGSLLEELIDYGQSEGVLNDVSVLEDCRKIAARLRQAASVSDLDALTEAANNQDFEVIAKAVQAAIENNELEGGLDRLHTFAVKFVRSLCSKRGISVDPDKALHALFGAYVKKLRNDGQIESVMTERILKSSISVIEAFNHVRNKQSLAHDNPLLKHDEALLIFNHVASSVRFIRSVERRLESGQNSTIVVSGPDLDEEIPF